MTQKTFALDRDTNFANLETALRNLPEWAYTKRRGLTRRLEVLLKQIEFCSWRDGCTARMEVLADRCGMSARQLRRTIIDAEALKLVEVARERDDRTGGQGPNFYQVRWEHVADLAANRKPDPAVQKPACHDVRAPGHHGRAPGHHGRAYKEEDQFKTSPRNACSDAVSKTGGWPEKLTKAKLADPKYVDRLYSHALRKGWVARTRIDLAGFRAAAVEARENGDDPGALFTDIVIRKAWRLAPSVPGAVSDSSDAKAAELHKLAERGPPPPRVSDLDRGPPVGVEEQIRRLRDSKFAGALAGAK